MSEFSVLLVDDEEEFIKSLSERLQLRDIEANTAFAGEPALEMVADAAPDVMVLDLRMPGIGGLEVLRRIKKTHPQVPVIILTGHGSEKDEAAAMQLGAFAYLQKPVQIDDLLAQMRRAHGLRVH